ncbi:hypothetical protein ACB094_12G047600 [Castanea mollissima]
MEDVIVLGPSPGRGHLISMVELGKLIVKHHPSFSITILILSEPNANTNSTAPQYVASSTTQYIAAAFIIDFFCDAAFEVATTLDIPTYYFFTSSPSGLAAFLYRPTLHIKLDNSLKDLGNTLLDIPGLPPIQASNLPDNWKDRTSKVYEYSLYAATHMAKSNGLVLNTFDLLETKYIKAISDGPCVPDGPTPPIFCIGPLISSNNQNGDDHECLNWLNSQPNRSVVFLCFGSLGLFSAKQLKEIAVGLEIIRNPPPDNEKDTNLDELLPKRFSERTKDKGFVVKQWVPQVAVLSHDSVGGFVTHCGWNSVLEAVWCGVPMVGWPLYAEQRLNRVVLVEEIKLALWLNESEDGFVSATELEKRVKELMASEVGREVRERISILRDEAVAAMKEGGSSHVALTKFAQPSE